MHFTVKGRGLDPKRVERALSLSIDKYCSASAMMAMSAKLTYDHEIIETGA
jgi:putative redox protein